MSQRLNLLAPEVRANPYPHYARLRRESPVCQVDPNGIWVITRYDDIVAAYKNSEAFSNAGMRAATEPPWLGHYNPLSDSVIMQDPPYHGRLRGLVTRAFTNAMLTRVESYTRDVTSRLMDGMLEKTFHSQPVDFISDFAVQVPAITMALLLGLDPALAPQVKRWSDDMAAVGASTPEDHALLKQIRKSLDEMEHFFQDVIDKRRKKPGDDLVTDLLNARVEGEALDNKEIKSFLSLLLMAGTETTMSLLSLLTLKLTQEPQWMERLRHTQVLIPQFIEEVLRFDPPVHLSLRLALKDTQVGGVTIPAHSIVALMIASGLRDETHFPDPDVFNPERGVQANLAFGYGVHYCLGAPLARMETRVALDVLLAQCARIELNTDRVLWNQALITRAPSELPVKLTLL